MADEKQLLNQVACGMCGRPFPDINIGSTHCRCDGSYIVNVGSDAPKFEPTPIPMLLVCPVCGKRHIDTGDFATKPHHTHACQFCGTTWRPAIVSTVGVQFLPGFKNEEEPGNVYG